MIIFHQKHKIRIYLKNKSYVLDKKKAVKMHHAKDGTRINETNLAMKVSYLRCTLDGSNANVSHLRSE